MLTYYITAKLEKLLTISRENYLIALLSMMRDISQSFSKIDSKVVLYELSSKSNKEICSPNAWIPPIPRYKRKSNNFG